jgi:hypothetical protein
MSNIFHQDVVLDQKSRMARDSGLRGDQLANRDNLPPHQYILINSRTEINHLPDDLIDLFERNASIPSGMGLKSLCPQADRAWDNGKKLEALQIQINRGDVSIEVYFIGGYSI